MSASEIESIVNQAQKLTTGEQIILLKKIVDLLAKSELTASEDLAKPQYLIFGEFHDAPGPMSTEEDFRIAEWHPTEKELSGE